MQQQSKILTIATLAIILIVGFSYAAPQDHFAIAKHKGKTCKEGSKGDIKADKKKNDDAKSKKKGGKGKKPKKPKPTASCSSV